MLHNPLRVSHVKSQVAGAGGMLYVTASKSWHSFFSRLLGGVEEKKDKEKKDIM